MPITTGAKTVDISGKEATIYDIARALKISPSTVSRGLNDHPGIKENTRKRIMEVAHAMGYQRNTFASSLREKKTNTLGVVIPRVNSYFMSTVIAGMEKVANEHGFMLAISQSQENVERESVLVQTMFSSRVDGLLVSLASDTCTLDHFSKVFSKKLPLVFFDRVVDHPTCTGVIIDNHKAGYEATQHLIEQGCKRIVFIGGSLNRNVYNDRKNGYRRALSEKGLPNDDSLILINDLSEKAGVEAAAHILKMNPLPDGIFASNDTSAVACLCELKRAGIKIPEQIAVVGFNNDPISRVVQPDLTTIDYPGYEMGEVAANSLINSIYKRSGANVNTLVLRHRLIVRKSSLRSIS